MLGSLGVKIIMRRAIAVFLLISLPGTATLAAPENLTAAYRQGRMTLAPDPDFAPGADWASLFFDKHRLIKVAPDGSIFVANSRDHNVSKFDADGKLVRTFGQRGQGPGDLEFPGELSVLDGRTLVVGSNIQGRKISLFGLDGKFQAVLKTHYPPSRPLALKNGKIAYIGVSGGKLEIQGDSVFISNINRVVVIDSGTGLERELTSFTTTVNEVKDGVVMIARSAEGDLLVGLSTRPEIIVYGPDGEKKGVVALTIDRIPVTKKITETYQVRTVTRQGAQKIETAHPMGEFLPYYCDLMVDSLGNILVFKMSEDPKTAPIVIQVYSPAGKLLCETELERGAFDLPLDKRIHQRLDFTEQGIFGILPLKGDELETPRLFRVAVRAQ